jgi:putative glutamine amidotransferase
MEKPALRIALSKGSPDTSYANYYNWVKSLDSNAICLDMYALPIDSAMVLFKTCSGLILTGGTDIHPGFYGKAFDTVRCWPVDDHRDKLEMMLIDSALTWNMPVLGICRGHQMLNVALGGSLVVDIPADFPSSVVHQCEDYLSCFHEVTVEPSSLLNKITGSSSGRVTSNHHQAAERLGEGLKAAAFGSDGLIEAVEWADPSGKPFLLGVQWHPERMDLSNPLSGMIGRAFLTEASSKRSSSGK